MKATQAVLRSQVICPHCWHNFPPEEVLWQASHHELIGDSRLGSSHPQCFLPSRFDLGGHALDSRGSTCLELACPNCHLYIPRALLELPPMFVSIIGMPSCGKSYFLAAMTWRLRHSMPEYFKMNFGDASPHANQILNQYEEDQFFDPDGDQYVRLAKTEEQGDMYDLVNFGEQTVSYPRPFQFTIRPNTDHPNAAEAAKVSRLLCLYDNAGESFLPGRDTAANPVTRHLSVSDMLLFCFDPTQDPRFRKACKGKTDDIQVVDAPVSARQETVLHEIGERIRKHSTLHSNERHKRPLVVIVTKYDAWWALLGEERLSMPIVKSKKGVYALNMGAIEQTSAKLRQLLKRHSPELVSAAEGLCEQVIYVPVSATGCGPQVDSETGQIGIRPRDVAPMWCEIPLLTALARWGGGMVPYFRPSAKPHRDPSKYPPGAE